MEEKDERTQSDSNLRVQHCVHNYPAISLYTIEAKIRFWQCKKCQAWIMINDHEYWISSVIYLYIYNFNCNLIMFKSRDNFWDLAWKMRHGPHSYNICEEEDSCEIQTAVVTCCGNFYPSSLLRQTRGSRSLAALVCFPPTKLFESFCLFVVLLPHLRLLSI